MHHLRAQVGARLQLERQRVGLTQGEFAEKLGIAKRTLAGYEGGNSDIGASILDVARSLGVDVLYVVCGERTPAPETSLTAKESGVIDSYRALPEADQAAVERLTTALAESAARYEATKKAAQ
ncbi:MAG: helix-turn-helix transcriptional regulator [Halopseudomonas sp.]|uniref:helix-turn-helix domain-containing protein n=1 Tax=Halopseudomonas sp. TaxID=2901191 RepID=UPI003001B35B